MTTVPKTLTEALKIGVRLIGAELEAAKKKYRANLLQADCGTLNPGDQCGELDCDNHEKVIFYCNGSGDCDDAVKVPC
jgi:hypothetical protein